MRKNLAKDPSLRSGTTSAFRALPGTTLSLTDDWAFYGKYALKLTKQAVNGTGAEIADPIAVLAGVSYSFSIYARIPVTIPRTRGVQILLQVEWLNSLGTVIRTDTSATLDMTLDGTDYRVGGVWKSPTGSTFANVSVIQPLPGTSGASLYLDALLIEQSDYIGGYFDDIPQANKNAIVSKAASAVPQVVNGIRLGADIVLNGLVLNTIDENDCVWVVTDIDGWWGQVDPELPDIPRGTEDGSYDVEGRSKARQLTLSGFFIPKDPGQSLNDAMDRLSIATNLVRQGGWLHTHEEPTRGSWVRLAGRPTVRTTNARGRTEFQIPLRAPDPVKYHWDNSDPDGFTSLYFAASDGVGIAKNIGTASVTGVFTMTGPAGAGTRVYNAVTGDTMTLQQELRGAGLIATSYEVSAEKNLATFKTTKPSNLRVGDDVMLISMPSPFSETDTVRTVTAVSDVFPYSFTVPFETDDVDPIPATGQIRLMKNDVLTIDTYNREVTYNGESTGHRNRLKVLTDWVKFGPGENVIQFFDNITKSPIVNKRITNNVMILETASAHYLIPGEKVKVDFPETLRLSRKQLVSNVVTLTTETAHGFSPGDIIDVDSTESARIISKSRTGNVATLTTETSHGANVSDKVVVALPFKSSPRLKEISSNVATLTFPRAHGFSAGDTATVDLPSTATITNKRLTNNQAYLATSTPHSFSEGDLITVSMPVGSTVVGKSRSGSQVIIETAANHGYSVNDKVVMALPVTRSLTGSFQADGTNNLITATTSTTHGYSIGDRIKIDYSGPISLSVTERSATTSTVTLTVGNNNIGVGARVTVSGVGARYNGGFYVTSRTATTISYNYAGSAESSTASSGSVYNRTVAEDFNGEKIIESIPTTTSFTYRAWGQNVDTALTVATTTITNLTNESYNGVKTLISASGNTFAYNL